MSDILGPLGVSEEAVRALVDAEAVEKALSGQICACGHARKHHREVDGTNEIYCKAAKFECSCVGFNPVLQVSDARFFMRRHSVKGGPEGQALTLGIYAVLEENKKRDEDHQISMDWIETPIACQKCFTEGVKLSVTPTTRDTGKRYHMDIKPSDKLIYVLLCNECGD
jgi:hypothetical protein